jgi:hypothetical protein
MNADLLKGFTEGKWRKRWPHRRWEDNFSVQPWRQQFTNTNCYRWRWFPRAKLFRVTTMYNHTFTTFSTYSSVKITIGIWEGMDIKAYYLCILVLGFKERWKRREGAERMEGGREEVKANDPLLFVGKRARLIPLIPYCAITSHFLGWIETHTHNLGPSQ